MPLSISQLCLYSLAFYPGHWQSGIIILWVIMLINKSNLKISLLHFLARFNLPILFHSHQQSPVSKNKMSVKQLHEIEDNKVLKYCKTMTLESDFWCYLRWLKEWGFLMAERNMFKATLEFQKRLSSENYLMLSKGYTGEWSGNKSIIFQLFCQAPKTISTLVCDFIYFPPCWQLFFSHFYLQG